MHQRAANQIRFDELCVAGTIRFELEGAGFDLRSTLHLMNVACTELVENGLTGGQG